MTNWLTLSFSFRIPPHSQNAFELFGWCLPFAFANLSVLRSKGVAKMKNGQLGKMSVKDLRALRDRVDQALAEREREERAELKAKMATLASKAGFSVGELFGGKGKARGPVAIKYRNPQDASQTWTGRGRRPLWIAKAGGDVERFRI
jgi:DNA-binding protein H-NS